jgi:hypothetical protein
MSRQRPPPTSTNSEIVADLRGSRAELDRRAAETTLRAMKTKGLTLTLSYERPSSRWRLSDGRPVASRVTRLLINDARIADAGDALFIGVRGQTYGYVP